MPEGRLRVLFVSKWLDVGGAERFVSTALGGLDPGRFDLHLCLFRRIVGYPVPEAVPLAVLLRSKRHRHWDLVPLVRRLARTVDEIAPDVVLSAYAWPSFVVGSALRLASRRPRWVARVASNPDWGETGLRRPLLRWAYARADLFLANSRALARRYAELYPRARGRIEHLPNPTDFERLDAEAGESVDGPRSGGRRPAATSRLDRGKRVDLMIEAVDRLRRDTEVELVVCGGGPESGALERLIAARGLDGRVRLLGHCPNPFAWMARSDLFVLASDHEGSPNALIEAQGLGLPAVASDCAFGPAEIIEPGRTGWLVPTGDAPALARAIGEALADPGRLREMGAAARERARRLFSTEHVCERLAGFLEGAAG